MNTTEKVAHFVASLDFSDVPQRAREIAKGGIIDALGVALASPHPRQAAFERTSAQ